MIQIHKSSEPHELTEHRATPGASYAGLSKAPVKKALLHEQGGICCYCMQRIKFENMRVEHWLPQSDPECPDTRCDLDYSNMLGACHGNEGNTQEYQYCDVRKGNRRLSINPADPGRNISPEIKYLGDGRVEWVNDSDEEFDEILNLNYSDHVRNRKAVYKATEESIFAKAGRDNPISKTALAGLIKKAMDRKNGNLQPYCGVSLYLLKKLERKAV